MINLKRLIKALKLGIDCEIVDNGGDMCLYLKENAKKLHEGYWGDENNPITYFTNKSKNDNFIGGMDYEVQYFGEIQGVYVRALEVMEEYRVFGKETAFIILFDEFTKNAIQSTVDSYGKENVFVYAQFDNKALERSLLRHMYNRTGVYLINDYMEKIGIKKIKNALKQGDFEYIDSLFRIDKRFDGDFLINHHVEEVVNKDLLENRELSLDVVFYLKNQYGLLSDYDVEDTINFESEEIQLKIVEQEGCMIKYITNPSEKVKRVAIEDDVFAIEYIDELSEELQLLAVQKDDYIFRYIKNPSQAVIDYMNSKVASSLRKKIIK